MNLVSENIARYLCFHDKLADLDSKIRSINAEATGVSAALDRERREVIKSIEWDLRPTRFFNLDAGRVLMVDKRSGSVTVQDVEPLVEFYPLAETQPRPEATDEEDLPL